MRREYEIKPLTNGGAAKAYPLIQAACPETSIDAWLDYTARLITPRSQPAAPSGIVVAECPRGYIHGLFAFSVRTVLNQRAVLAVENFIALEMGDRAAATKALIDVMEKLAMNHDCSAIHTSIPDRWATARRTGNGMMDHLRAAGHKIEYVNFSKALQNG